MSRRLLALVRDRRFGDAALKRVVERLAEAVDDDGAGTFPDMAELADDCELGIGVLQRALREVRDAGLIDVTVERGGGVRLRLCVDDLLARPLTGAGRRRFPG